MTGRARSAVRRAGRLARFSCITLVAAGLLASSAIAGVQERAEAAALVEAAVAALGGARYTAVTSAVSRGVFTQFVQGKPTVPVDFVDTFVMPDRERTEFGKKKSKIVQANAAGRGWKYDGLREKLEAQTDDEIRGFATAMRANIDNLLRAAWRAEGVELRALGRKEVSPRRRANGVAVVYPDGFTVQVYFDVDSKLPVLVRYHEGDPSSPGALVETWFNQYIDYDGVKAARFVDFFRDGIQTGRVVNDTIVYNAAVAPEFFSQPTSVKALK